MKRNKKNKRTQDLLSNSKLLRFFADNKDKAYGISAIKRRLRLDKLGNLVELLETLEHKKLIERVSPGKWIYKGFAAQPLKGKEEIYEGVVDIARAGFAYILCKGLSRDIFVSQKNLLGAQDGDFVQVRVVRMYMNKPEGVVIKVLQRSRTQFVGVYRAHKNHSVVLLENAGQVMEIFLQNDALDGLIDFDRVVVEITHWKQKPGDKMQGKVVRTLGQEKTINMEMESILAGAGFPLDFPAAVLHEAAEINEDNYDLEDRRDFREVTTFTIDPVDAKDFDDALSYSRTEDGLLEIGIHIADVSHFVKSDSALDKEALKRGNSVYLVDRVLPMLPEKLSNELCSLRPLEDKLTFSVVFTYDEEMSIKKHWIGKSIIHSKRRFTYEEVQEILHGKEGDFVLELNHLNDIAKHTRKERLRNGAIDFESDEVRFKLDEAGLPKELFVKQRLDAHMLIEEFMLLANKYVAQYMAFKNKSIPVPFVYRIHDLPDPDKLQDFMVFAHELGVKLDLSTPKKISKSLNQLAELIKENEDLKILQPLAIRTMAKAEYNPQNIGHYGLAFEYYTHFTSPIRRYADLMVHRILFDNLKKEKRYRLDTIEAQCRYISSQERKAMEAERESTRYFQVFYLKDKIGEIYDGRITGMNDRGFYVQIIENQCEGVLLLDDMDDEIEVKKNRLSASSSISDQQWKMGDRIKVKIVSADLDDRELVFGLVDDAN
ncbi:MAG: ribonuclease R [Saprospiraceae bacterium]|nr:ribonuclease R [Candidatus Vicinibacter affinis]MBK6571677.1 ribonuclease R [Candidatus Vicinibacter affinis]MBK7798453.1 ribonuclease R [Candidatus Vicinibacter affinis]MBP6172963.1 ribonuclease R [Saprospiraceae bacterium]